MTRCKNCGRELQDAEDKIGETIGFVCVNPNCSERGVIV